MKLSQLQTLYTQDVLDAIRKGIRQSSIKIDYNETRNTIILQNLSKTAYFAKKKLIFDKAGFFVNQNLRKTLVFEIHTVDDGFIRVKVQPKQFKKMATLVSDYVKKL